MTILKKEGLLIDLFADEAVKKKQGTAAWEVHGAELNAVVKEEKG